MKIKGDSSEATVFFFSCAVHVRTVATMRWSSNDVGVDDRLLCVFWCGHVNRRKRTVINRVKRSEFWETKVWKINLWACALAVTTAVWIRAAIYRMSWKFLGDIIRRLSMGFCVPVFFLHSKWIRRSDDFVNCKICLSRSRLSCDCVCDLSNERKPFIHLSRIILIAYFCDNKIGPHFNGILWLLLVHSYVSTKKEKKSLYPPNNGPYVPEQYTCIDLQAANDALHLCVGTAKHVAIHTVEITNGCILCSIYSRTIAAPSPIIICYYEIYITVFHRTLELSAS